MARPGRKPKGFTKEHVLLCIKGSGSIVTSVARKMEVDWHTAKAYIDKWDETRQAFADESETMLDLAESTLYSAIKEKDVQAAKWLLATKGKSRGFTERHEHEHSGAINLVIDQDDAKL